ncbi:M56 family metallopeptidase [Stigmatella aurantiaca]|uniref:TonB domain/peptidase M56 domain protein n=1 Tax=Stigmatella aurantiaca (strain DW4/3-1) TaxID=378806 RepID=Q09BI6_STIAD|nr:M56 family metallopeptidase [Stigmatella aurantiaca]ADO69008.1 TonB domain/peptidase M56 domain protein [Stigmatella aurantiaca DW4/3-1]EAU69025.1 TonB domain/peptidase M56 domain protein [Stigmatella aurantiaca DW4/3-1]
MTHIILESLGWALLHLLWQGALVAAVLALGLRLLGQRASARYGLACGALGAMLVLPVATGWQHFQAARLRAPSASPWVSLAKTPEASPHAATDSTVPPPAVSAPFASPASVPTFLPQTALEATRLRGLLPWLVLAWGLGVVASSLRLLAGWMRLRRSVRAASPVPEEWQQRLEALSRRLGMKRAVRLLQSTALDVPSALGWLRPVVLLPVFTLTGLSTRQLEMILAHELAHIRRHDFVVNLLQTLVETLLFYHPAIWWMSHVIRVERENCCDDLAAGLTGNTLSYARALTALEALRVLPSLEPTPALSALGGSLPERVRRLVAAPSSRCASRWAAGASVLTLMSSLAVAAPLTTLVLPSQAPRTFLAASPATPAAVPPATPPANTSSPVPAPSTAAAPKPAVAPPPPPSPAPKPSPSSRPSPRPAEEESPRVGKDKLSVDQLVALKVAGVTPSTLQSVEAMGYEPTVDTLTQFGHAGITEEYMKGLSASFGKPPSAEELVQLKHLGVTAAEVEAMKRLGFSKVTPDTLASAHAVGVNEAYVSELKAAGYTGLELERITDMRAVGVTPDFIQSMREAGLKDLSTDDLTQLRVLGVSPAFIQEMRDAGLEALTTEELIRLRTSGIDTDFIRRLSRQPKQ